MDGESIVRIFGEDHTVKCKNKNQDAFSAHADAPEFALCGSKPPGKTETIILVHARPEQSLPLKMYSSGTVYRTVIIPVLYETITV